MKFSCDGNSLKSSINLLASLLPPRATLPSLSAILIESDQGFLSLTAFNLSVGLKLTIAPEQVQGNFKILVPGDVLNKLVSTMVQSQKTSVIEFEVDKSNDVLIIANQFGTVEIALLDPGSFPEIPRKFTQDKYLEIDSEMLQLGISRTTPFTGPAERFILSGVNFKSKNHQLSLTTTDGRTAAMANFEIKNNSEISTVIGEDFLSLLNKIIKVLNIDELTLPIYFDDIQVFIDLNLPSIKASIWGRVLDGAFPDVNKIIPTEFTYSIQVLKADLLNALDIIESVSANVGKPVDVDKIKVVINNNDCVIEYSPVQERKVEQKITLEYSNVDTFAFALNKKYLLKHLKSLASSSLITLQFNTSTNPIKITGVEEPIEELGIIMPISLGT